MPNWKKIALSGSSPEFASLTVDNSVSAGSISGSFSGSFGGGILSSSTDSLVSNLSFLPLTTDTIDLGSLSKQWRDLFLSSGSLYINGTQVLSTDGTDLTIQTDGGESFKVLETGNDTITLETANGDITLTTSGTGNIELDAPIQIAAGKKVLSSDGNSIHFGQGIIISGSIQVTGTVDDVDIQAFSSSLAGRVATAESELDNTLISSSAQIATEVSGSGNVRFEALNTKTGSIETDITALETFSSSLSTTSTTFSGSFSGSFEGDGSSLTGIDVGEVTLKTDTFTSVTSKSVSHTFGTKDVNVTVYDSDDKLIIPASVTTTDTSTVDLTFDTATTGRVVITKGGHIVTGSIAITSQSTATDSFTSQTSYTASHTFGTTDVFVQVYDDTDSLIIPQKIKILTTSSIGLDFDTATSGKIIIGKSGHIVSGSAEVSTVAYSNVTSKPTLISSSYQIQADISGSLGSPSAGEFIRSLSATGISGSGNVRFEALNAATSSYVTLSQTSSMTVLSSSFALTASSVTPQMASDISGSLSAAAIVDLGAEIVSSSLQFNNLSSPFTGSFTGSFVGDGSNLTGVTAAGTLSSSAQIAADISGSGNVRFEYLNAATSSYVTLSQTGSMTVLSSSYAATSSRSVNKNTNSGSICFWQGSSAEYSALGSYDPDTVYFVV